jgi:hypothetical protein
MSFSILGFTLIRTRDLAALSEAAAAASSSLAEPSQPDPEPADETAPPAASGQQAGGPGPARGHDPAQEAWAAVTTEAPPPIGAEPSEADRPPKVVHEVLRLADGVLDLRDSLGAAVADGQPAGTVLRWAGARATSLMAACEVTRVEESGVFDPARHKAVASREAPSADLVWQIADTVRAGYAWRGSILRSQEVVVYAAAMNEQKDAGRDNF